LQFNFVPLAAEEYRPVWQEQLVDEQHSIFFAGRGCESNHRINRCLDLDCDDGDAADDRLSVNVAL
jgi:hypothetical protein